MDLRRALLHAAEVADQTRESHQFGVSAALEGIDMAGVTAYQEKVVSRLFKGLTGLIRGRGITVIEGEGRMTGPRQVTVTPINTADSTDERTYAGKHLVLASGSYSRSLPGLDIDGCPAAGAHARLADGGGADPIVSPRK